MRILRNIVTGLIIIVALLAAGAFLLPSERHVERDAVINAPPQSVFALLNDHREFNRWSPWAERDPDTKYEFTGPSSGVGARVAWASEDPDVGSGTSEIIESVPNETIRVLLDFGSQGTAIAYYTLTPRDGGTHIVWGFDTNLGNNPIGRYFGLMLDKWVGGDYEAGLANLKALAEG